MRLAVALASSLALLTLPLALPSLLASIAHADDANGAGEATEATTPKSGGAETPFVYVTDPTTPRAKEVNVGYVVGSASAGAADRPIPADPTAGIVQSLSLGYGITSQLAPFATISYMHDATGASSPNVATANLGLRFQLTDPGSAFRFTVIGVGFREFDAALGASLRAASSYDIGVFRLAGNLHFERVFRAGRDSIDVLALAGASFRVVEFLRLGAEYVGQDLEDAFEQQEAEGGAKHYVGPNAALDLAGSSGRIQLVFGPAFALNKTAKGAVLGRAALLVAF